MPIRSVERAFRVLQELNLQPVSSIAQLHGKTGLPKPTLVRILKTLEDAGYVDNDPRQGGYQVTALVDSLSSGYHGDPLVVEAGRAWAVALTRAHQWPIAIALFDTDAVVVRFSTVPNSAMSPFHKTVNMRLGLFYRGLGLAYLAFAPDEQIELTIEMLARSDDPENALARDPKHLWRMIETVRKNGYAERAPNVEPSSSNTLAAPIFNEHGRVTASIGLTYFTSAFRTRDEAVSRYLESLQRSSQEISGELRRLARHA